MGFALKQPVRLSLCRYLHVFVRVVSAPQYQLLQRALKPNHAAETNRVAGLSLQVVEAPPMLDHGCHAESSAAEKTRVRRRALQFLQHSWHRGEDRPPLLGLPRLVNPHADEHGLFDGPRGTHGFLREISHSERRTRRCGVRRRFFTKSETRTFEAQALAAHGSKMCASVAAHGSWLSDFCHCAFGGSSFQMSRYKYHFPSASFLCTTTNLPTSFVSFPSLSGIFNVKVPISDAQFPLS